MRFSRASIRYARALYALAEEYHQNDQVYEDMKMLMDVFADAKEIRAWMASPIIPAYLKQQAVNMFFKKRLDALSIRFIDLIITKNRSADVYGIIKEYVAFCRLKKGISRVVVGTPYALTSEEREIFADWFARNLPDQNVELINKVQPFLLGGFTLKVGWQYADKSIAGRLQHFRRKLARVDAVGTRIDLNEKDAE